MTAPLTDQRLGEIQDRARLVYDAAEDPIHLAGYDVPDLLAEIRRLRTEAATLRAKAVYAEGEAERWQKVAADREPQRLARELAERTDQLAALQAEFDQFADICSGHSADRDVEQIAHEDLQAAYDRLGEQAQRITEAASQFRAERDRLHDTLADALLGTWESNGAGDVRSPWIPAAEVEGWRRLLATTGRSEEA